MTKITVVVEISCYTNTQPLIYIVEIPDDLMVKGSEGMTFLHGPGVYDLVRDNLVQQIFADDEFQISREYIYPMFAFRGDVSTLFDWRD